MTAKLRDITAKLRKRLHGGWPDTVEWLQQVVRGYFQFHAIPGNTSRLQSFRREVLRLWYRTLRRRSQRSHPTWERFFESLASLLPAVQILHPYPSERFDAKHPNIRGKNRVR
jgi:hypothetical protein